MKKNIFITVATVITSIFYAQGNNDTSKPILPPKNHLYATT